MNLLQSNPRAAYEAGTLLILAGGGPYSLDALLTRRRSAASFR